MLFLVLVADFFVLVFNRFLFFSFRFSFSFQYFFVFVLVFVNGIVIFSFLVIFVFIFVNENHTDLEYISIKMISSFQQYLFPFLHLASGFSVQRLNKFMQKVVYLKHNCHTDTFMV